MNEGHASHGRQLSLIARREWPVTGCRSRIHARGADLPVGWFASTPRDCCAQSFDKSLQLGHPLPEVRHVSVEVPDKPEHGDIQTDDELVGVHSGLRLGGHASYPDTLLRPEFSINGGLPPCSERAP